MATPDLATDAGAAEPQDPGVRLVVQTWLGSRLLILLVALWVMASTGSTVTDVVANWDVQHFVKIAKFGYIEPKDVAFFPGLPLLMRLGMTVGLDPVLTGVLVSLAGSAVAAAALYRMGGPRYGTAAAVLWLLAPTAVFTAVPYTESVFCAFAFWSWIRAREDRWAAAALLAAGAAAMRVSGLFLIAALVVMALTMAGNRWRRLPWLLIPAAVPLAYAGYLRITQGSWLAWYRAQSTGWSRTLTWPWDSLRHTWPAIQPGAYADHPGWAWVFRAEVVSVAVGIVVTIVCLWRRRWPEATWVGLQVLAFTTSYWFMSVNRAVLLWFPLWLGLAHLLTDPRHRRVRSAATAVWLVVSSLLLMWWSWLFFTGRWAS